MNPIGTISGWLGQQSAGPPGVGGYNVSQQGDVNASNPGLIPMPGQPGYYMDPGTGQIVSQDPNTGQVTVNAAPNANQLTAQATGAAGVQQQQQQQTLNQFGANLSAGHGAIGDYTAAVNGSAPSVAGSQLQTGLNQITGQQEAIAAGATGNNQPAAQRTMAQNITGAQIAANGQQAQLRAQEVAAAEAGRAGLIASTGKQLGDLYSQQGNEAVGYTGAATTNQGNELTANTSNTQFNAKQNKDLLGGLGQGISSLAALA